MSKTLFLSFNVRKDSSDRVDEQNFFSLFYFPTIELYALSIESYWEHPV